MNKFSMGLGLSLIKAAILTLLIVGAIASMSSCTRMADERPTRRPLKWRARALKNNKVLFVQNIDSLGVLAGDTVLVNYNEDASIYYISNFGGSVSDTAYFDALTDSTFYRYEALNVVLERPY